MSGIIFDRSSRIPPEHPLTEAARIVNAVAEERGLEGAIEWLGVDATVAQFGYLAEQRVLRVIAASSGYNMGTDPVRDEEVTKRITSDPAYREKAALLIAAHMDGLAVGWKAHELSEADA